MKIFHILMWGFVIIGLFTTANFLHEIGHIVDYKINNHEVDILEFCVLGYHKEGRGNGWVQYNGQKEKILFNEELIPSIFQFGFVALFGFYAIKKSKDVVK